MSLLEVTKPWSGHLISGWANTVVDLRDLSLRLIGASRHAESIRLRCHRFLLVTSASPLVTSALLVVTMFAISFYIKLMQMPLRTAWMGEEFR